MLLYGVLRVSSQNIIEGENQLTSLDVTKNTMISIFACGTNKLSTLDVLRTGLKWFSCETIVWKSRLHF
jgi:hypothetical protein